MNERIEAYTILKGGSATELANKVSDKLGEGWQPFDSLAVCATSHNTTFSQAVVRFVAPPGKLPARTATRPA